MVTKKYLKAARGERIDFPDFQFASDTSQRLAAEQIGDHMLLGSDSARGYLLDGFGLSAVGTVITVTRGVAIASYRDPQTNEVRHGSMLSGGAASRSMDIGAFPDGTYFIYVKLQLADDEFQNRIFWDPLAPSPTEAVRTVPTRRAEDWALAIDVAPPGEEWTRVGRAVKTGAAVVVNLIGRELFFEGLQDNEFLVTNAEWGTVADRDNDREANGVKSLRKFVRAVQRQLTEFRGQSDPFDGWWKTIADVGAQSLLQLTEGKLERDGSNTVTGHVLPDANNTRNLGSGAARFATIFAQNFDATSLAGRVDATFGVILDLAADILEASYLALTSFAPGALPVEPRIYRDTILHGWGYLVTNGAGGFSVDEGVGATASIAGANTIRLTFDQPFDSGTEYSVVIWWNSVAPGDIEQNGAAGRDASFVDLVLTAGNFNATANIAVNYLIVGRR